MGTLNILMSGKQETQDLEEAKRKISEFVIYTQHRYLDKTDRGKDRWRRESGKLC